MHLEIASSEDLGCDNRGAVAAQIGVMHIISIPGVIRVKKLFAHIYHLPGHEIFEKRRAKIETLAST